MAADNPWFLITQNEIEDIRHQLASLEKESPVIGGHQIREISGILQEIQDRWS